MTDKLHLRGVSCRCRIGVPEEERASPQEIVLDVCVELDLSRAGKSDDLRFSLDYQALETRLREAAEKSRFKLIESLAEALAALALDFSSDARAVTLAVRKKPALMPGTREVCVEIRREKTLDV